MKILIDEKARSFAKKKNIKEIFINPDLESKESCCGIATVDFHIGTKPIKNRKDYKLYENKDLNIYINPNIFFFVDKNINLEISAFGLGSFKKFYIKNEINMIDK